MIGLGGRYVVVLEASVVVPFGLVSCRSQTKIGGIIMATRGPCGIHMKFNLAFNHFFNNNLGQAYTHA